MDADTPSKLPDSLDTPSYAATALPPCDPSNVGQPIFGGEFTKFWTCGHQILIYGPAQWQSAVENAAAVWNGALRDPAVAVPFFGWGGTSSGDTQILLDGSGSLWCGGTNSPPTFILMTAKTGSKCSTNAADFATTLVHEFAHVMGFKDGALEKQTTPTNCALHLPDNGTINGSVCQHELEFVYAAYGFRSAPGPSFWAQPVVTGLAVSPLSVTVQVDQTQAVAASQLIFARQMTGSVPLGTASVTWTSDNPPIASVNPTTGVVIGVRAGTTTIRGKVSNLSSAYQVGTLMSSKGQEITVTVTAGPPPGTGFRVTAINGVTTPVTVAGTYPINASVTQQPTGTLQLSWKIVYSTAPLDTLRVTYGPNNYGLGVPAGSYTVRVYATPRSGSGTTWIYGAEGIQDFTVCTGGGGGGGGNLAAPIGDDGTDAVAGC